MKNLTFVVFPIYVQVTFIKSKLEIPPVNPTNPDILKFIIHYSLIWHDLINSIKILLKNI